MSPLQRYCEVGDCMRLAARNGKCSAHVKRAQRGKPLSTPIKETLAPEDDVIVKGNAWLELGPKSMRAGAGASPEKREVLMAAKTWLDETDDEDEKLNAHHRHLFLAAVDRWNLARGWTPPGDTKCAGRSRQRLAAVKRMTWAERLELLGQLRLPLAGMEARA